MHHLSLICLSKFHDMSSFYVFSLLYILINRSRVCNFSLCFILMFHFSHVFFFCANNRGVQALAETIAFFLKPNYDSTSDKDNSISILTPAAYIMNVAHHMTNLDMLKDSCEKCGLDVSLIDLKTFVPHEFLNEFPNAYMAKIVRKAA